MLLHKFKIYCETDAQYEYIWLEEGEAVPTKCPVDHAHTVTAGSASIEETKDDTVQKSQTILSQDGLSVRPFGFHFTAASGTEQSPTETVYDYTLTEDIKLRGAHIEVESHDFFDEFDVQIVHPITDDIVNDFARSWQSQKDLVNELVDESISDEIPSGLKVRIKYRNVGAEKKVAVTMFGYK